MDTDIQSEAKARWGHTDAWKQSQERTKHWTKEDFARMQAEGDALMREIVANMDKGAASDEVQALIAKHYDNLRKFYEPNPELYRGLAELYVSDPRFAEHFRKFHPGLPEFMKEAMEAFCDTQ